MLDKILIVDFGSQFTQLIARRIREHGVYCEIVPYNKLNFPLESDIKGVVLSGSPASVQVQDSPRIPEEILSSSLPILGICYGAQAICTQFGGEVVSHDSGEFGHAQVEVIGDCPLFTDVWTKGEKYPVWMSHGDRMVALPQGFQVVARSELVPFSVIYHPQKRIFAVQFHPEVVHTPHGNALLANFIFQIAGCSAGWSMSSFCNEAILKLRSQIGEERVICGLSGGVDSAVAAVLLHQAVGDQLVCIFVDHGFMRQGEVEEVLTLFRENYDISLVHVNAQDRFFVALEGEADPERKRKIIGELFIEIFEEEARKLGNITFLAQGTLYPDVIESISVASGSTVTIKSHHNVGGLPERMNMKLVEPLRELFKDEVRLLAKELSLPAAFVHRHPFPGPGLAIRCPGDVTPAKVEILRKADAIYLDEIRKADIYDAIWQAFVVLLPVRSVGVMGDSRTYEYVCALRAVTSVDGMSADFYKHDMNFLGRAATRIINEVRGINRVVYDITSKPPGTIEWE